MDTVIRFCCKGLSAVLLLHLAMSASPAKAVEAQEFLMALNEGPAGIQRLLDQGMDPDAVIPDAGTPLMLAISQGNVDVMRLLVTAGADVNKAAPPMNLSPLGAAASFGNIEVIGVLLELGADPRQPQPGFAGQTPLSLAKMTGNTRLVALLEAAGSGQAATEAKADAPLETRAASWRIAHESDSHSPLITGAGVAVTRADNAFVARSLDDGTERWRVELDLTSFHGNPGRTLSMDEDTVYFAGGQNDAHFYAVDANTGNVRWKFYTGGEVWKPPVAVGGTVFASSLYLGGDDKAERGVYVWVVDKRTGTELARTFIQSDSTLLSPPMVGDGMVYITVKNVLSAIDPISGRIRWQFEEPETQAFDAAFGNVMLSSSSSVVAVTAKLRNGRDQGVYFLDAYVGGLKSKVVGAEWIHNATMANGTLYTTQIGGEPVSGSQLVARKTYLTALDPETGEEQWRFALDHQGKPWANSPVVSGDAVYYWTDQGFLHAVDRDTGDPIWRFDGERLSEYRDARVAVADGTVYLWAAPWMYAIDADSGQAAWGHPVELFTRGDVVLADGALVFKNRNSELVAVQAGAGPEVSR